MATRIAIIMAALLALAPAQVTLFQQFGTIVEANLGYTVRNAGDVDGDGVNDVIASAPGGIVGVNAQVFVYSGATGILLRQWTGPQNYGRGVDGCGDINGDGLDDVIIGRGASGCEIRDVGAGFIIRLIAPPSGAGIFGDKVAGVGDVNGDNVPDVAISAYNSGTVEVASGATGAIIHSLSGGASNRSPVIAPCSDIDGDGVPEILTGIGDSGQSRARVFSGGTGAMLYNWQQSSGYLGYSLAEVGDISGDGIPEIAVGGWQQVSPTGFGDGVVNVYSGQTGALIDLLYPPLGSPSDFGRAVAAAGDLNADGVPDVAVGAEHHLLILSGATGTEIMRIDEQPASGYGWSLDPMGDIDGDGYEDLALGARYWVQGLQDCGMVAVISGRIMGEVTTLPAGCGGGPFLPVLGATRPVIGQSFSFVGVNAPVAAQGYLLVGDPIASTLPLGYPGCELWVDPLTAATVPLGPVPASASWSLPIALPSVPLLAGWTLHLQSYYLPTGGPLGLDVSNGIKLRLGY
jgi:hypothetical protein